MATIGISPYGFDAGNFAKWYFPVVSVILVALSLVAFKDNLVTDIGQPSNSDPKMIVHGFFALAWMVVLALQANFVRAGNMRWHRKLGMAGFVAAIGVTLSTLYLFVAIWKGWALMEPQIKANRILLPSFSLFIILAYFHRSRPAVHKRLVYTGTLFLMEPILARCFEPLMLPLLPPLTKSQDIAAFDLFMTMGWSAFFLTLFAYDLLVLRRVHPVSAGAYAWLLAVNGFVFLT